MQKKVYGAIDINGALNTAITIRTMVVQPQKMENIMFLFKLVQE